MTDSYLEWLQNQIEKYEARAEDERGNTLSICEARMNAYRDAMNEYIMRQRQ